MNSKTTSRAIIIGGGPAGLIAAEILASQRISVSLYERNSWVGRKFLVAGKSGLNLTNNKPFSEFLEYYGSKRAELEPSLIDFSPSALRQWADGLGAQTFIGSSGKIFPEGMKAAPLLAAWKKRLDQLGVHFFFRHELTAFDPKNRTIHFKTPEGSISRDYQTLLFALGGGSWRITGSTGEWIRLFSEIGIDTKPLKPANMGFDVDWSEHLITKFAGTPIKTVSIQFSDKEGSRISKLGEFVLTNYGLEGNLIYALSAGMRDSIELHGPLRIELNLLPNASKDVILEKLTRVDPKRSLSTNLSRSLSLPKEKIALLWEVSPNLNKLPSSELAGLITCLPITLRRARPIDEAISSAGGVCLEQLDEYFMVKKIPGVFFAGEMLDWEAPTGGYLLNGVIATGARAAAGMTKFLVHQA